jgi:hypothetical protein
MFRSCLAKGVRSCAKGVKSCNNTLFFKLLCVARPLRIEFPGTLLPCDLLRRRARRHYLEEGDRQAWLEIRGAVCERFRWVCHAYRQMTNPYHLLVEMVETLEANLSRGMRQLNGVYTHWFNRIHHRVGHVFQGHCKAILVEKDSYLLETCPLRCAQSRADGCGGRPGAWPWSSYTATIGGALAPEWLRTDWLLGQFGNSRRQAVAKYVEFVRAGWGCRASGSN